MIWRNQNCCCPTSLLPHTQIYWTDDDDWNDDAANTSIYRYSIVCLLWSEVLIENDKTRSNENLHQYQRWHCGIILLAIGFGDSTFPFSHHQQAFLLLFISKGFSRIANEQVNVAYQIRWQIVLSMAYALEQFYYYAIFAILFQFAFLRIS